MCFPVKFAKFLGKPILKKHLQNAASINGNTSSKWIMQNMQDVSGRGSILDVAKKTVLGQKNNY